MGEKPLVSIACFNGNVLPHVWVYLLLLLHFLRLLATLVTFAIRLLRYTCCACYSSFAIFTILATFACYSSYPCYVDYACNAIWSCYACYIQQVVSTDHPVSETFCLMTNPIYLFILSKLVQFSISCKKRINQDFDQPIRTSLQWGIPHL